MRITQLSSRLVKALVTTESDGVSLGLGLQLSVHDVVLPPPPVGDGEGEAGDEEQEEDDGHDDDQQRVEVELRGLLRLVGTFQLPVVVVGSTLASVVTEELPWRTGVGVVVPAGALTALGVPAVGGAVEAVQLGPGEAGQTLTGAGGGEELLSGTAGGRAQGTLTPAGTAVVLQLDTGAVRGAVHVDNHRVFLQLGLLRRAAGA